MDDLKQLQELGVTIIPPANSPPQQQQSISDGTQQLQQLGVTIIPPTTKSSAAPTPQRQPSLSEQFMLGVKESLMPFGLTTKEAKQEPTLTRSLANLATDIGQSLAAGAVGGMVAGPVGALVAGVGTGVYRALGLESVRAKAEGRSIDPAKAGVNLVAELLPTIKTGKTLTRVAMSAAQGVAQYTQASQYGAAGEMAALVGVLGGGLTYAARGLPAMKPTADDITSIGTGALVANQLKPAGVAQEGLSSLLADKKTAVNLQESYIQYLTRNEKAENAIVDILTNAVKEGKQLKSVVHLDDKTLDAIRTHEQFAVIKNNLLASPTKQRWVERNKGKLDDYVASLLIREAQDDLNINVKELSKQATNIRDIVISQRASALMTREFQKVAKDLEDPLLGKNIFTKLGADYFVARVVDDATGLGLRSKLDRLAMAEIHHKATIIGWDKQVTNVQQKLAKLKINRKDIGVALELDDEARQAFLKQRYSDKQLADAAPILAEIRTMFDNMRAFATNHGVTIPYRANYVTSIPQEFAEIAKNMGQAYKQVFADIDPQTKLSEVLSNLPTDRQEIFKQLYQSAERILDEVPQTVADIKRSFLKLRDPDSIKKNIGFELSAAYARTGVIPELIRERDIVAILKYYGRNISRAVHLTPQLKELQSMRDVLAAGGFNSSAKWLDKYLTSVSGAPGHLDMAIQVARTRSRVASALLTKDDPFLKRLGARIPEFAADVITFMPNNLYAAYLGGDIGPLITNMTQNWFATAPEIGGKFGTKYVAQGFLRLGKQLAQLKNPERLVEEYFNVANLPEQFAKRWRDKVVMAPDMSIRDTAIRLDAFRDGVQSTGAYDVAKNAYQLTSNVINKVGLWLYNKSDGINRYVTIEAGKELTKAYLNGKKHAIEFVQKADKSLQNDLLEIRKFGGSAEQQAKLTEYAISSYLISKTQFFYTRSQSFQAGREWGSLVTQFTKFPIMVGSDIAEGFYRGGTKGGLTKVSTKYLAPLLIAKGILDITTDEEETEREKILRLNSALRSAPISSVVDINPPPLAKIGKSVSKSFFNALDQDFETALKTVGGTLTRELLPGLVPGTWASKAYKKSYSFITNEPFPEED